MEPTIEQIRETIGRLDNSTILSCLPLMRNMAKFMGERSSAAVMVVELCREGVERGILE